MIVDGVSIAVLPPPNPEVKRHAGFRDLGPGCPRGNHLNLVRNCRHGLAADVAAAHCEVHGMKCHWRKAVNSAECVEFQSRGRPLGLSLA